MTHPLSAEEAEKFRENTELLKKLLEDESTPERKLLSCYANVKAVIDELNEKRFEDENENSSEPVTSDEEPPIESEPAESQPTESAPEQGKAAFPFRIALIFPAVIIAGAVVLVVLKSKKK